MVSRIMISLKKAADSQQEGWPLGELPVSGDGSPQGMVFFRPQRGVDWVEDDL